MRLRPLFAVVAALALLAAACSSADSTDESIATTTVGASGAVSTTTSEANNTSQQEPLIVQDGDALEVHYVGTLDDGSTFDSSRDRDVPFAFTVGTGQVIPGFDAAVRGASVGDVNTVRIEAAEAYGEWSEDNVIEVPFNSEQDDVQVGDQVFLTSGQSVIVLEITSETVTLDANHSLAGKALTFEIEILSITRG